MRILIALQSFFFESEMRPHLRHTCVASLRVTLPLCALRFLRFFFFFDLQRVLLMVSRLLHFYILLKSHIRQLSSPCSLHAVTYKPTSIS